MKLKKLFYDTGKLKQDISILQIIESNLSFVPVIDEMKLKKEDPFKILVTILMSARTKDEISAIASEKLFKDNKRPEDIIRLSEKQIEKLIYPVGFYKTKAKHILSLSKILLKDFDSLVPDNLEDLLKLPGVGFKTATLVLATVFDREEVCVDTHVHRISNRLDFVKTKTTLDTHYALKEYFPSVMWQKINYILVSFGKTICRPVAPKCKDCKINKYCFYGQKTS